MKKRILSIVLALTLCLSLLPMLAPDAAAASYTASEKIITIRIQDHAEKPVSGEGEFRVSGPIYYNGKTANYNGHTITHALMDNVVWDFSSGSYDAADLKLSAIYIPSDSNVKFDYTYTFSGFGNKYGTPTSGSFKSNLSEVVLTVDRYDIGLQVNLKNDAGNTVNSGVTVTMNGRSDSTAPYTFDNLREGSTYKVAVSGNGYEYSTNYTVQRTGVTSRTLDMNIGTAKFPMYVQVNLGGQPVSGATVKYGDTILPETGTKGLYSEKVPDGKQNLEISGAGLTDLNVYGVEVTSAGYPADSPYNATVSIYPIAIHNLPTDNKLAIGTSHKLEVGSSYDKNKISGATYSWTSSNPTVATVSDNGVVTPLTTGEVTITATCTYGTASRSTSQTLTVEQGTGPMISGTLSENTVNVRTETITLPGNVLGAKKLTVTAVSTDANGTPVNKSLVVENPVAGSRHTMDFGQILRGPVTYTFVYESDVYAFSTDKATVTKTYLQTLSVGSLAHDQYEYTGAAIKPVPSGLEAGTYTLSYASVYRFEYDGVTSYWTIQEETNPNKLTTDNDIRIITILGDPFTYEDCLYAVIVTGNSAAYYTGSYTLPYRVVPRSLTVIAEDQNIPYATTEIDTTAVKAGDGQLLSGHTITGTVQLTGENKLSVVQGSVRVMNGSTDVSRYYSIEEYRDGVLGTVQNTQTDVDIMEDSYNTVYTYGDLISTPAVTVSGAYASDVLFSWYNKDTQTPDEAQSWDVVGAPKNVGTYIVVAYTEENDHTSAASDSIEIVINKRTLTVVNAVESKLYDGNGEISDPAVTFAGLQYADVLIEDTDYVLGAAALTAKDGTFDVGTDYTLTGTVQLANTAVTANYALSSETYTGTAAITRRSITEATIEEMADLTYCGSALTPDIEGRFKGMMLVKDQDYELSYANNINVGKATVTVTGIGNYTGTTTVTFNIRKATPTVVTNPTASAINYGQTLADSILSGGLASVEGNDDVAGTFSWADADTAPVVADSDTTSYAVIFTPVDTDNYNSTRTTVTLTVNPKSVTVTASAKSKIYRDADPVFDYTVNENGLVGDDQLVGQLTRETGEDVGGYTITQGTLTDEKNPNYAITYVPATLTIEPKVITAPTILMEPESFEYDKTEKEPAITVMDGDVLIPADEYIVSYSNNVNAGSDATVRIMDAEGGNYTVSGTETFTITPKSVTITVADQYAYVGGRLPDLSEAEAGKDYTVDGLVGDDTITVTCPM